MFGLHLMLSGERGASVAGLLINFVQITNLILPANVVHQFISVNAVVGLFNVHLPTGGNSVCPFDRPLGYFNVFEQVLILALISAIQVLLGAGVIFVVVRLFRGYWPNWRRWIVRPLFSLLLATYTPLSDASLSMLNCRRIGPFKVLEKSMWQTCSGALYARYSVVAVAMLVIITICVPLVLGVFLWRSRSKLAVPIFRLKFGYFYEEFREACSGWNVVVLIRRSVLAALLLIPNEVIYIRYLAVSAWVLLMLISQVLIQPHKKSWDNIAELISFSSICFVTFASIAFSATFASNDIGQYTSLGWLLVGWIVLTLVVLVAISIYARRDIIKGGWQMLKAVFHLAKQRATTTSPLEMNLMDSKENLFEGYDDQITY